MWEFKKCKYELASSGAVFILSFMTSCPFTSDVIRGLQVTHMNTWTHVHDDTIKE